MPPWLSDRVLGPLNATIAINVFTLLVVLAVWLPVGASSVAALFIVVALMCVGTGSFVPLGGKYSSAYLLLPPGQWNFQLKRRQK